jgi:hypothetical protein
MNPSSHCLANSDEALRSQSVQGEACNSGGRLIRDREHAAHVDFAENVSVLAAGRARSV